MPEQYLQPDNIRAMLIRIGAAAGLAALVAGCGVRDTSESPTPFQTSETIEQTQSSTESPTTSDTTLRLAGLVYTKGTDNQTDLIFRDTHQVESPLTRDKLGNNNAQISPDGMRFVFYSHREDDLDQIYTAPLSNPSDVTRLTNDGASDYDPVYLPDGRIVYKSNCDDGHGDIWIMNNDGSEQRNITPTSADNLPEWDGASTEEWKPEPVDNNHVIITSRARPDTPSADKSDDLYLLTIDSGELKRLTNNQRPDWFPTYNQHTKQLVYISRDASDRFDVLVEGTLDLEEGALHTISEIELGLQGDSDDPKWSPNGKDLLFINNGSTAGDKTGDYQIYQTSFSDKGWTKPVKLTKSGNHLAPTYIYSA